MATLDFNISNDAPAFRDLGSSNDTVNVSADAAVENVRLTFTSAEVGNGSVNDSDTLTNQDGGLAVRARVEDASGSVTGSAISRFEDEGVSFVSDGTFTFDVRDLVSGAARGSGFDVVTLGNLGGDAISESGEARNYYINAGAGNDSVSGGFGDDFLVGGSGKDFLSGQGGDDSFIGGLGNDGVFGGSGRDTILFNTATEGSDRVDLGTGTDLVSVTAPATAGNVRLTFTSTEVGNGSASDSGTLANQDGGFAVRLRAEDGAGSVTGSSLSRFDDEGVRFVSATAGVTFDVRDLVTGVARGNSFEVVELGTESGDTFSGDGQGRARYINGGRGDDSLTGGSEEDFLVGGSGNDFLSGQSGDDNFIAGGGDDRIFGGAGEDTFNFFGANLGVDTIIGFESGSDKLNLRSFEGVDFEDVTIVAQGDDSVVSVDTDGIAGADLVFRLDNSDVPSQDDFLFAQ